MSFWQRLLISLGLRQRQSQPPRRSFELNEELAVAIQKLAKRERRPTDEIAADLLVCGLAQHDRAQELYRYWQSLSPRQQQVTVLVCRGYTNRQIAEYLTISEQTVKTHLSSVLRKFNLRSRIELRTLLEDWEFKEDW